MFQGVATRTLHQSRRRTFNCGFEDNAEPAVAEDLCAMHWEPIDGDGKDLFRSQEVRVPVEQAETKWNQKEGN